jgi:hypothetical protein
MSVSWIMLTLEICFAAKELQGGGDQQGVSGLNGCGT